MISLTSRKVTKFPLLRHNKKDAVVALFLTENTGFFIVHPTVPITGAVEGLLGCSSQFWDQDREITVHTD